MQTDDVIIVGDKVELAADKGRVYKTMIEDKTANGLFLAVMPSYGGLPMFIHEHDEVTIAFFRETGRYAAHMQVVGFEKKGEIRYVWLMLKSKPQQVQRRDAYRLAANIKVLICEYIDDMPYEPADPRDNAGASVLESASSKDISATGIALSVKWVYQPGDKRLLRLHLNEQEEGELPACAEVIRLLPEYKIGAHSIGMRFFGLDDNMREYLAKYVLAQQQEQIRQKRYAKA